MNIAEIKGFKYLENKYLESRIRFFERDSPDFIMLPNNKGYEIKQKYSTAIYFHSSQYDKLKATENVEIMVFDTDKDDPISIFHSNELLECVDGDNNRKII